MQKSCNAGITGIHTIHWKFVRAIQKSESEKYSPLVDTINAHEQLNKVM